MLRLIERTGREFGISIVLSSHLMSDVETICDSIVVLDSGRVMEQGALSRYTGETHTLYIDVDDRRDELVATLAARGVEATVEGVSIVVDRAGDEEFDSIRDAVVEVDARLRRLAPRRHGLAEIFRKTTG